MKILNIGIENMKILNILNRKILVHQNHELL